MAMKENDGSGRRSPNPREGMMKRRMKMERRGRLLHLDILHSLRTFPRLVTSSAGKRGSPSARADQNDLRQRLDCRSAQRRSPASLAHLLGVFQVPPSSSAIRFATAMMVGLSSLGSGGAEPPSKRAHPWSFLPVSSQCVHGVVH
jgi:hypothetical protein